MKFFLSMLLLAAATNAAAEPSIRYEVVGSAIYFYASNPEDRGYGCNLNYVWQHNDYGATRQRNEQTAFTIGKTNGEVVVHRMQGSYVQLNLVSWQKSCR
jgi:hypothetical protein